MDDFVETDEIPGVPGVGRQAVCGFNCGDEQFSQARSAEPPLRTFALLAANMRPWARAASVSGGRGSQVAVRSVQAVLTPSPLGVVDGGVGTGSELGKRHHGKCGRVRGRCYGQNIPIWPLSTAASSSPTLFLKPSASLMLLLLPP